MTFLSPFGALIALAALAPLGAALLGRARVTTVRKELGLRPPRRWHTARRLACAAGGIALLGLAAAQPALTHTASVTERTDVQALFVFDVSRSMSASAAPGSPTRLQRAVDAATRLRASIPGVPAGVATLTDRVLPNLLPVAGVGDFDAVARRSVKIENPPPIATSVVATNFTALRQVADGDYFDPGVSRRIVVLLTDGESAPFDPGHVAHALARSSGYRVLTLRVGNASEQVFGPGGRAESGYHPNPAAASILDRLAAATGGRSFSETGVSAAASYLHALAATGPSATTGGMRRPQTVAPYVAAVAVLMLLAAVMPPLARSRARAVGADGSKESVRAPPSSRAPVPRDTTSV